MKFHYPIGATPLDLDEIGALIPKHISLQAELNEWEHQNIMVAEEWAFSKSQRDLISVKFLQKLHEKMFDQTWSWAGDFRKTQKNIGVEPYQIHPELHKLCDDLTYQLNHTNREIDEIVARLHHRLVSIHPFSNGNGRHARLYADLVLVDNGQQRFSWGSKLLSQPSEKRSQYIEALRQADDYNFEPLMNFVRS